MRNWTHLGEYITTAMNRMNYHKYRNTSYSSTKCLDLSGNIFCGMEILGLPLSRHCTGHMLNTVRYDWSSDTIY
jgi:hypothetical protein